MKLHLKTIFYLMIFYKIVYADSMNKNNNLKLLQESDQILQQKSIKKEFEYLRSNAFQLNTNQINRVLYVNRKFNDQFSKNSLLNEIPVVKHGIKMIGFDEENGLLFKPGYAQLGNVFGVRNSCINKDSSKSSFGEYETSISITNEQSKSQQEKMLAIRNSLRLGIGAFSADNSLELQNKAMFDKTSITYKYENSFTGDYQAIVDGENLFAPFAESFYKNNKMAFMLDCGNSFVYKEKAGAKILGYLSIDISNTSNSSVIKNNFKASYSSLAEITASVSNANKSASSNLSMSTKFIQYGGEPFALSTALADNKCNADNLDGCNDLFNKVNKYAVDDFRLQLCKDGIEVNGAGKFVCKNGAIDRSRLRYFSPVLVKYLDVKPSLIIDDKNETQKNKEAIARLEKLFETTLLIRYRLEELEQKLTVPELISDLQKSVLDPIRARQVYLLTVGNKCYEGVNSCETLIDLILHDLNVLDKYKIDANRLKFYLTDYKIQNYLNMANSAGLRLSDKNIDEIDIQPVSYKDNMYTYKYPICSDYVCNPFITFIYFNKIANEDGFNLVNDSSRLVTKCTKNKLGNNYECKVTSPNSDIIWTSIITPVSLFSSNVINDYVSPSGLTPIQ